MAKQATINQRVVHQFGYFFSHLGLVLGTLTCYLLFSIATYLVLVLLYHLPKMKSLWITYTAATASDPLPFETDLKGAPGLLIWILLFRLFSWLLVPVLIAAAVDAAYRVFETRRKLAEVRLLDYMREMAREYTGLTGVELDSFVRTQYEEMLKRE